MGEMGDYQPLRSSTYPWCIALPIVQGLDRRLGGLADALGEGVYHVFMYYYHYYYIISVHFRREPWD